jgi:regulator of protease activity HflC (stomatin/prohibitin superfamily)
VGIERRYRFFAHHHDHGPGGHHHHHDHGHHHHDPADGGPVHFTDPAQESLSQALKAGFNVMRVIMIVLLIAYFASGWFQVKPGDQGLIVRFGQLRDNPATGKPIYEQGWHFALPDPFDTKITVPGQFYTLKLDTFLFKRVGDAARKPLGEQPLAEILMEKDKLEPGEDGAMLSGDRNLSHGIWTVEFRIDDAAKYVRNVGSNPPHDFRPLLQRVTENAVIKAVAGRRIEEVLRYGRPGEVIADIVSADVQTRIAQELARLDTGVTIIKVTAETIEPGRVRTAFYRVNVAQNEQQRLISEANQQRTQLLNEAAGPGYEALLKLIEAYGAAQTASASEDRLREMLAEIDAMLDKASGQVADILSRASTRRDAAVQDLRREYEEFIGFRDAYRKNPFAALVREWVRMRSVVLGSVQNEIFYMPRAKTIEILTNRDPERALEAERQRFQGRGQQ